MIYEDYFKSVIGGNFKSPEYYNTTYENKTYEPIQVNGAVDDNFNIDEVMDLYPDIYKVVSPMIDKMLIEKDTSNLNDVILNTWTLEIYDSLEAEDNIKQPNNNQIYESETTSVKPVNKVGNITDSRMASSSQTNLNQTANINQTTNLNQINQISNIKPMQNTNQTTRLNQTSNTNEIARLNQTSNINQVTNSNLSTNASREVNSNQMASREVSSNQMNGKEDKTIDVVSRYQNRKNPLLRDLIKIMILNKLFGNNNNNRPPRPPYQDPNNQRPPYPGPNNPGTNNPRPPFSDQNNQRPPYPRVNNQRLTYQEPNNSRPTYNEISNQLSNSSPVDANPYSKYLKNTTKSYFDVPYPEEG